MSKFDDAIYQEGYKDGQFDFAGVLMLEINNGANLDKVIRIINDTIEDWENDNE